MGRAARIRKTKTALHEPVATSAELYHHALEALRAGREAAAILILREVLLADEAHAPARFNLATALLSLGRLPEAVEQYRILVARQPVRIDSLVNLAEALRRLGDNAEAIRIANRAVEQGGHLPAPYLIRGAASFEEGDHDRAADDLRKAIAQGDRTGAGYKLLGKVLLPTSRKLEALDALRHAAMAVPGDGEVHRLLGDLLDQLGLMADSFAAYRRAIEIDPGDVYAYTNLSGLLCKTKLLDVALSVTDVALKLAPDLGQLHYNRAMAFEKLERSADALACYDEALRCDPESGQALLSVCRLKHHLCDWIGLDALEEKARRCSFEAGRPAAPFSVVITSSSPIEIMRCNEVWSRTVDCGSGPLARYEPRPSGRRAERLRLGYVSADFHGHATAQLIAEVFEHHDPSRYETYGFSIGATDNGQMRQRLAAGLEHFHDISDLAYDDAAALIRSHEIDILVDLKGYTHQARPEILARRPAPIQVNYLGYPSTMGASFIDYVIGDRIVTPLEHASFYTEKIVQLPNCYQPNDRHRAMAALPTRADEGLPDRGFVFCCLNAAYKITSPMFDIWAELVREIGGSVLWLYAKEETTRANLRREATARGVDPARLVFADKKPPAEHLARMALADLFLDTSPCGAHTTGSEALWAGLPMLTLLGQTFASRVGASLLVSAGLPELVTTSLDAYRRCARDLAENPLVLAGFRNRLAQTRLTMPLFDSARYTRDLETAYARMAATRDAGEGPKAILV